MKTKILFLAFLTFVFTAIGQNTLDLISGDYNHAHAMSPSGNHIAVASDGNLGTVSNAHGTITVPAGEALLRIFTRNTDNTFSMTTQFILPKGTTSSAASRLLNSNALAIDDVGNWAAFYRDDHLGNISHYVLQINGTEIDDFTQSMGVNSMEIIDGALYMSGQANSGIPFFKKYDMATNNLLWDINPGGHIPRIVKTAGFNPHLKMSSGDLVEFDDATGANLGLVATGNPGDRYQINPHNGVIESYRRDIDVLETSTGETDWFVNGQSSNFFTTSALPPDIWLTRSVGSDKNYTLSGTSLQTFGEHFNHNFKKRLVSSSFGINEVPCSKIFDNGDVTLVGVKHVGGGVDDIIGIFHIPYTSVAVPTLNNTGTNVVSVHPGQIYDAGWVDVDDRIGTVVLNGTMPNVGDLASFDWVNEPSGYTLFTVGATNPIIQADENNNLFVRFVFKPTIGYDYQLYKVYLKSSSALGVDENSLDVISMFPNPVNNILTLQNAAFINEINIFNILGQNVLDIKYSENTTTEKNIDVSFFKNGAYTMQIKSEIGILNKKFIKK